MLEILTNRRSVRKFAKKTIEDEKLNILKKALLLSPTSRNIEPWEFITVRDKEMLDKLGELKQHSAQFLKTCDTAIVIIGDTTKSDTCIEDCSIASVVLQLTAESLGLGSCWAQVRLRGHSDNIKSEEYVRSIMNIPENYLVLSVIGLGYPAEKPAPREDSTLKYNKIHTEKL